MKKKRLSETHLELAKQWHPTKNGELTPQDVTFGSNKKVWWICEHGHEWEAKINHRSSGSRCPYCNGKRIIVGKTDLATKCPHLAKQWHPTKNGNLTPQDVSACSGKKVWWQCQKGHEWEAQISNRSNGNGCPCCSGKGAIIGKTDLITTHLELAKQWHPTKNGNLIPQNVSIGSGKKVWWLGDCGHEWQATINHRSSGSGCPYCSGRQVIIGKTDLMTTHPELAKQWHPTQNGDLTPQDVTYGSTKKVWWICEHRHEWQATINNRSKGSGCPYCKHKNHKRPIVGKTDLATTHPELAKQWHPTKNGNLTPQNVSFGSGKKVWWLCDYGHEWEAVVNKRSRGTGCPYCFKET